MKIKVFKLKAKTFKNSRLPADIKRQILVLKDSFWNYGVKNQLTWLNKNISKEDIHNCVFHQKKLVGYTLLRKRKMFIRNKNFSYFLIDTVIVSKKSRKKNLGIYLMKFNNKFIRKNKKKGFLICKKKLINFYEKTGWKKLKKNMYSVNGKNIGLNGMSYNFNNLRKNKLKISFTF